MPIGGSRVDAIFARWCDCGRAPRRKTPEIDCGSSPSVQGYVGDVPKGNKGGTFFLHETTPKDADFSDGLEGKDDTSSRNRDDRTKEEIKERRHVATARPKEHSYVEMLYAPTTRLKCNKAVFNW